MADQIYEFTEINDDIIQIQNLDFDIIISEPVELQSTGKTPYQYALEYGYTGSSDSFYNA